MSEDLTRFKKLDFEGFRRLARDESLSPWEKIGFPRSYREGKEHAIWQDILSKLPRLSSTGQTVVDIGPGCSELLRLLMQRCAEQGHELVLVDSPEMLARVPDAAHVRKVPARFPDECRQSMAEYAGRAGVVLTYSVLHYVFEERSVWEFTDRALELLAPGGEMLIGDIPNSSKRKRFFSSAGGKAFHRAFMGTEEDPEVTFNRLEPGEIDDAVVFAILMRARSAGYDAYVLPQRPELPTANRREDIFIRRP